MGAILALGAAGILLCSAVWSIDPLSSARTAISYVFIIVGAIGVAANFKSDEYMDLLALMCFLSGIASLVLFVVSPALVVSEGGDFIGIFSQKNVLGEAMTMGALASLHGIRAGKRRRLRNAVFLVLITIVALKSACATSCLTIFVFCGTGAMIALIQKGGRPHSRHRYDRLRGPHSAIFNNIPGFRAGNDRQGPDFNRAHGRLGLCDPMYLPKAMVGVGIRGVLVA